MRIGVKLPNSGPFATAAYIERFAVECERLGYDSIWVHDHVTRSPEDAEHHFVAGAWEAWPRPIVPDVFESMSTLLFLAGKTSRVSLGTSVVVLPLRNPVWLAKVAATLDQFSGGRLILGVGVGGSVYVKRELAAIGDLRLNDPRGRVTDEWIDIMRGVWREPKFSWRSNLIEVVDAEVFPKPVQDLPPIWIAGPSRPAKQRVALRGDGWIPMFLRPAELREGAEEIGELALRHGRDPKAIQIGTEHWLAIDKNRERAFRRSEATRKGMTEHLHTLPEAASFDITSLAGREDDGNLVGTPDSILEQVAGYREAGVHHLILRVIGHTFQELIDSLQMFREQVWARLA